LEHQVFDIDASGMGCCGPVHCSAAVGFVLWTVADEGDGE
jgi:hypothetical protein